MEVTKENFKEALVKVKSALDDAIFVTIDGEFTGLHHGAISNLFDTPEERYQKFREGCENYLLIQFGLCTFHYDKESNRYSHQGFNFYIFPRSPEVFPIRIPDVHFLSQSSSIDFLAAQGFDFNKVIKKGITYLSITNEAKYREELRVKHSQENHYSSHQEDQEVKVPDEHKEYIENTCNKIEKFIADKQETTFDLTSCNNPFIRLLIYQAAKKRFSASCRLDTRMAENRERYIVVTRITESEDIETLERAKKESELEVLDNTFGFTKVIKMLKDSEKLIVGHNMILDLMHLISQFVCPLPQDYQEFKEVVRSTFPKLIDTKLFASTAPLKDLIRDTTLGELQKILMEKPFTKYSVDIDEDSKGYKLSSEKLHEAGYDAFLTGVCFIGLANHLGTLRDGSPEKNVACGSKLLEPFLNKIVVKIYDLPYIDLENDDVLPNRDHVLHLTFPKEWKKNDILKLFQPFGNIIIGWINEASVFVSLYKKDQVELVLKTLTQSDVYKVITYQMFKKLTNSSLATKRTLTENDHSDSPAPKRSCTTDKRKSQSFSPIAEVSEDEIPTEEDTGSDLSTRNSFRTKTPAAEENLYRFYFILFLLFISLHFFNLIPI